MSEVWDQRESDAFGVRAHHIDHLMELERDRKKDTGKLAYRIMRRTDASAEDVTDLSILDADIDLDDPELYKRFRRANQTDVLGLGKQHAPVFEKSVQKMLQRYVELQEDDPVIVGAYVLDGICNGCAFQRHCRNFSSPDEVRGDQGAVRLFAYVGNDLGLEEQLDVADATITTNGHVLKSVVGKLTSDSTDLPSAIYNLDEYGDPYDKRPASGGLWDYLS